MLVADMEDDEEEEEAFVVVVVCSWSCFRSHLVGMEERMGAARRASVSRSIYMLR